MSFLQVPGVVQATPWFPGTVNRPAVPLDPLAGTHSAAERFCSERQTERQTAVRTCVGHEIRNAYSARSTSHSVSYQLQDQEGAPRSAARAPRRELAEGVNQRGRWLDPRYEEFYRPIEGCIATKASRWMSRRLSHLSKVGSLIYTSTADHGAKGAPLMC